MAAEERRGRASAAAALGTAPSEVGPLLQIPADAISIEVIDGRTYGSAEAHGVSFIVDPGGWVRTVHLHAAGHDGYEQYRGDLPAGLSFGTSQDTARSLLGTPVALGEAMEHGVLGPIGAWDRFDVDLVQVHLQYANDLTSIELVTLMHPAVVPGRMG